MFNMHFIPLSVVVLCFSLPATSTLKEVGKNVITFRGERDRFTNVSGCTMSNAVCFNENCNECQCMVNQTFIQTRGQYGKCISSELVVYATSYEDSFVLQEDFHKFCLNPYYNKFVVVGSKCGYNNADQYLWMWTNFGQLLNWQTLECMTEDYQYLPVAHRFFVTMKKCDRNNQQQHWECRGQTIKRTGLYRYMYYGAYGQYVTTRTDYASKWTRFVSKNDVCSQAIGCEVFADGSSLVILDKARCEKQSECLGEKKINLSKTKCFLLRNKTQYLHNDTWTTMGIRNGSFAITGDKSFSKTVLLWDLTKTPKSLGGLLVKVQFECEDSSVAFGKSEHCVLIKYTGTFKGFQVDGDDDDGKDGDNKINKNETNTNEKNSGSEKDNTQTIVIVVSVLIVLLLIGVMVFVIYRYRNRFVRSGRNTERRAQDVPPSQKYADAINPLYSKNNNYSGQRECELYEATPEHVYQYADPHAGDRSVAPQNRTYHYAVTDGPLTRNEQSSM